MMHLRKTLLSELTIDVNPLGNVSHNQVILAGFAKLSRQGKFAARFYSNGQKLYAPYSRNEWDSIRHVVLANVHGVGLIVFDTHDGPEIHGSLLDICFAYFKRSYDVAHHKDRAKIHPLGLNYLCHDDRFSLHGLWRALFMGGSAKARFANLLRELHLPGPIRLNADDVSAAPLRKPNNRVLFVARLWEPHGFEGIPPDEIAHRIHMNKLRIDCILELRQRFGSSFTGGLIPSTFSREIASDLIVDPSVRTDKVSFLKLIQDHDICIATRGLLDSNGWSFAEYVAKGRAIVCERPRYELPSPFAEGLNYRSFASAGECADHAVYYANNLQVLADTMELNRTYFAGYGRPEALVINALAKALMLK